MISDHGSNNVYKFVLDIVQCDLHLLSLLPKPRIVSGKDRIESDGRQRGFGLMVVKDALRKKVLWRKYVTHATTASYMEGVPWLKENGFKIYGTVIDGMRGLAQALRPSPVQLCQFHQMLTVRHYLTREARLGCIKGVAEPRKQYNQNGQGELCRCV